MPHLGGGTAAPHHRFPRCPRSSLSNTIFPPFFYPPPPFLPFSPISGPRDAAPSAASGALRIVLRKKACVVWRGGGLTDDCTHSALRQRRAFAQPRTMVPLRQPRPRSSLSPCSHPEALAPRARSRASGTGSCSASLGCTPAPRRPLCAEQMP